MPDEERIDGDHQAVEDIANANRVQGPKRFQVEPPFMAGELIRDEDERSWIEQ